MKERSPTEKAIARWSMLRLTTIPALTMTSLDQLETFRQSVYAVLGNGRDALFDLMDAILVSRSVSSFAELSLSSVFRRQWLRREASA